MESKVDPEERPSMSSIHSRLSPAERTVRLQIMDRMIATGKPVDICWLVENSAVEIHPILEELAAKRVITRDGRGNVAFAYPVSVYPTPHRVTLADRRALYAISAVDALGVAFAFDQDTRIESYCMKCWVPLEVSIRGGRLAQTSAVDLHVLHVDPQSDLWSGGC